MSDSSEPRKSTEISSKMSSHFSEVLNCQEDINMNRSLSLHDGEDSPMTKSLPAIKKLFKELHYRSDGYDSGLGSEIVEECTPTKESDSEIFIDPAPHYPKPLSALVENLKTAPPKSSFKRKLSMGDEKDNASKVRKTRGITFDSVTVFHFPRTQGFTCVPWGLGMSDRHTQVQKFSIVEHANEQRRIHRELLQQKSETVISSSSGDSDGKKEVSDASELEMDLDNYYFLQPISTRQRRALLRAAGVRKTDSLEKDECRTIRSSRGFCGCGCKGSCDPDTCSCSQAGIKCQVEKLNFPCGCTRDNCRNSSGRREFNRVSVRTHLIDTLMRLELEEKQEEQSPDKNDLA